MSGCVSFVGAAPSTGQCQGGPGGGHGGTDAPDEQDSCSLSPTTQFHPKIKTNYSSTADVCNQIKNKRVCS